MQQPIFTALVRWLQWLRPKPLVTLGLLILGCTACPQQASAAPTVTLRPVLQSCQVGEWRLSYQLGPQGRTLRQAQYGHRYPDNTLKVRQSYDQQQRLSGISVQASGFAGPLLNARAAATSAGKLLPEQGFRRKGFETPLSSYLRTPPATNCLK